MRGRLALLLAAALASARAAEPPPLPPPPELAASRRLFDSWKGVVPPRTLAGNIHYVGLSGVSSFLITTPAGHFLLDTAFEENVPQIARNIGQLGFKVADI